MQLLSKLLILLLSFSASYNAQADTPYQIPRSDVIDLKDPSSERVYPIFIKLPESYYSDPDKSYPVIYVTDARFSFTMITGSTAAAMHHGGMQEAIIVGISYSKGSKNDESRTRDFTPTDLHWKVETGKAKNHAAFIREVVFPYIDNKYRTQPGQRTYIGHSFGGLFGAYILFNFPSMFSSYILASPTMSYDDHHLMSIPMIKPQHLTKVYLSAGSLEKPKFGIGKKPNLPADLKKLTKKIKKEGGANIEVKQSIIEEAKHPETFGITAIQGLFWIYGNQ